jgi:hypothetical protein
MADQNFDKIKIFIEGKEYHIQFSEEHIIRFNHKNLVFLLKDRLIKIPLEANGNESSQNFFLDF